MASALNTIKNFMEVLNNTDKVGIYALNDAVKAVSKFSSWSELTKTMVADCQAYNGNGTTFLKNMCGINLSNTDTGAITGSDAGGGSTKTAQSIVPESGSWKYPSKTSFKIQGLTVTVPKKSILNSSKKYIVGALYTWWIKNSLTLIKNSFGLSFTDSDASVKKIDVNFYDASDGKVAYVTYDNYKKTKTLHLKINMNYFKDIDQTNPNGVGSSKTLTYLDRTIAHELTHAVMAANIDYFSRLPVVFKEGSAELVHGIDDKRTDLIKSLANNSASLRSALNSNGASAYAAGYMVLRYLAKQAAANRDPSKSVSADIAEDFAENYYDDFAVAENNFIEKTSDDELFTNDENNFAQIDEILDSNFAVADNENFSVQDKNIFSGENTQIYYGGES